MSKQDKQTRRSQDEEAQQASSINRNPVLPWLTDFTAVVPTAIDRISGSVMVINRKLEALGEQSGFRDVLFVPRLIRGVDLCGFVERKMG